MIDDPWSATTSICISLNRRGIPVLRDVSFDVIADRHAIHLGLIVDTDAGRFTVALPDGHVLRSDILDPPDDRVLFYPFPQSR